MSPVHKHTRKQGFTENRSYSYFDMRQKGNSSQGRQVQLRRKKLGQGGIGHGQDRLGHKTGLRTGHQTGNKSRCRTGYGGHTGLDTGEVALQQTRTEDGYTG